MKRKVKETFVYGDYVFDITAAKSLVVDRVCTCYYQVTDKVHYYFGDDEIVWEHNPDFPGTKRLASQLGCISIDKHRALTDEINLSYPLIGVFLHSELIIIDGYHRIYKAWKTGVKTLPLYILTMEECDVISKRIVLNEQIH